MNYKLRDLIIFLKVYPIQIEWGGFASGDSSFNIKVSDSTNVLGQRVQLRYGIGLNIREEALIQSLAAYFGLTDNKNVYFYKDSVRFEIVNF